MKPVLLVIAACAWSTIASANPRPLPFSYPYETLPSGKFEIEQYADLVPVRVERENLDGTLDGVFGVRSILQTELEFGITDRLEFGWYFAFRQGATSDTPFLRFSGVKQRLRYRVAEAGELPVDVGLYLEIAEFHDEFEVEEKVLLSRRFGAITAVVNLWVEQEYYFQTGDTKYIFNPTAGVSYELSPRFIMGLEYWARGRFDSATDTTDMTGDSEAPIGTHHYLGPTFLAQKGSVFLSVGAYLRLDGLADSMAVGDPYGRVWLRSLIGIEL
jgi:hypothetical protein